MSTLIFILFCSTCFLTGAVVASLWWFRQCNHVVDRWETTIKHWQNAIDENDRLKAKLKDSGLEE